MNNVIKKNLKNIFNFFPIILSIFLIKANINENKIIKDTSYENISKDLIIKNIDIESYSNYQEIIIDNGTAKQIIPNITENYTFLTFEIIPNYGKIVPYICINDCNDNNSIFEISENYKSYFYTYNKKESDNNQTILLITCGEGLKIDGNYKCVAKVNIYTDNNIIDMNDEKINALPLFKYISKDHKHKYFFKKKPDSIYLNIALFSGNISIKQTGTENITFYEYKNNKLYIFPKNEDLALTIVGWEDSFYSIYDYTNIFKKNNSLLIGSNYLLNIENERIISLLDYFYYYSQKENFYYFSIYPFNCTINVKEKDPWKSFETVKKDPYQYIISSNSDYDYYIYNKSNDKSCLCFISLYQLDNINGISLANDIPQIFIFNEIYNNITFSYPYTAKDNDINISFNIFEEENKSFNSLAQENYTLTIKLNGNEYLNTSNKKIILNETIMLKYDDIKNNCNNFSHICKIVLYVQSKNYKQSKFEITLKSFKHVDNDYHFEKPIIVLYILIFGGICLFATIFLVLYNLYKIIFKKEDLMEKINETTFEKELVDKEINDVEDDDSNLLFK